MLKAAQETPSRPTIPSQEVMQLRVDLIGEEFQELAKAMDERDLIACADAITDLLVVAIGTAVAFGLDLQPLWDEVHRSNMSKFIDGHRREDGKWVKGPSYSPANLIPIIKSQQG